MLEPLRIYDAEGQPSASPSTDPVCSARFSDEFYDIVLYDFLHENILGDSKHLNKITKLMWKSINNEDNVLSLN